MLPPYSYDAVPIRLPILQLLLFNGLNIPGRKLCDVLCVRVGVCGGNYNVLSRSVAVVSLAAVIDFQV